MEEGSFSFLKKWRFWIGFQIFLIVVLNIIVFIVAKPANIPADSLERIELTFVNFCFTLLGFPMGIYFLFHGKGGAVSGFFGIFFAYILPIIYYPAFLSLVWYIAKGKKHWRWISTGLLIFMLLSFGGCAQVTDMQLVVN